MPDAQLNNVLDQIRDLLCNHNMAGMVAVSNAEEADFRILLDADWLCADMDGDRVIVRCHADHYPDRDAQVKALSTMLGTFSNFRTIAGSCHTTLSRVIEAVLPPPPAGPSSTSETP